MTLKKAISGLIDQLNAYGCTELAASLQPETGIGPQFEPAGSLNGYHLSNPYTGAINALITGGLAGCGMEVARRAVDITFNAVGVEIKQAERDRFAYVLNQDLIDFDLE